MLFNDYSSVGVNVNAALVFDRSSSSSSPEKYKVFRFSTLKGAAAPGGGRRSDLCVDIYSSETGKWTMSSKASLKDIARFYPRNTPPVFLEGAIYLSTGPYNILRFDVKEECSEIIWLPNDLGLSLISPEDPFRYYQRKMSCLGVCEGRLCYACHNWCDMQVWMMLDDCCESGNNKWVLKHVVQLEISGFLHPVIDKDLMVERPLDMLAFHPSLGAVLIRGPDGFYWYDFQNRKFERIMSWYSPFEVYWVYTFFDYYTCLP